MHSYDRFYIGGQWVTPAGSDTIDVISPHTEEIVGRVPEGTAADMDRAVAAAREAFDNGPWPRMAPADRADAVGRLADLYAGRLGEIAELITEEMGSPITFSQLAQAPQPQLMLSYFADLGKTFTWEDDRPGTVRAGDRAAGAGRRRGGDRAVERAAVHHDDQAPRRSRRRLHGGAQASS